MTAMRAFASMPSYIVPRFIFGDAMSLCCVMLYFPAVTSNSLIHFSLSFVCFKNKSIYHLNKSTQHFTYCSVKYCLYLNINIAQNVALIFCLLKCSSVSY